jgi:hypothetical protein
MKEQGPFTELIKAVFKAQHNVIDREYVDPQSTGVEEFVGQTITGDVILVV